MRICTISGRRLGRISLLWLLAVSLLRLFLIWRDVEALDRREHSAIILSAVDAGIDIDTLARLKVVEKPHLVAGELYQYIIGMHNAVAIGPRVIEYQLSLSEGIVSVFGGYLLQWGD